MHALYYLAVAHLTPQPPTVARRMEAQSEHAHVASTFFCAFVPIFVMPNRCFGNKISASELWRKFIKSALSVGDMFSSTVTRSNRVCKYVAGQNGLRLYVHVGSLTCTVGQNGVGFTLTDVWSG